MKLYTFFRSTASFRVRIALNLKSFAYETISIRLRRADHRTPEFLQLNPQGLIPALDDEGQIITQSLAIIEYLEEKYPQPPLLPAQPLERAQVRSLALAVACDIHPLNNLRVLEFLENTFGLDKQAVLTTWYHHWIAEGFRGLEVEARRFTGDGRYMFGNALTLADVCIFPQMYNATRMQCDVTPYPTLRGICEHLQTLPAFAEAMPEVQPDAQS